MATQMLTELAPRGGVRYRILELSGALAARQRETIAASAPDALRPAADEDEGAPIAAPDTLASVSWIDALPEPGFRGVVLANEVVDALPVERFEMTTDGVSVHCVELEADRPVWHSRRAEPGSPRRWNRSSTRSGAGSRSDMSRRSGRCAAPGPRASRNGSNAGSYS